MWFVYVWERHSQKILKWDTWNRERILLSRHGLISLPSSCFIRIQHEKFCFSFGMNLRVRSSSESQLYLSVPWAWTILKSAIWNEPIMVNHVIWVDKILTYHSDKSSKEKSLDKVLQVLFHPCVKQKLNHLIDWLPWLEFARKYEVNKDYQWLSSSDCHFHSAWWFSKTKGTVGVTIEFENQPEATP